MSSKEGAINYDRRYRYIGCSLCRKTLKRSSIHDHYRTFHKDEAAIKTKEGKLILQQGVDFLEYERVGSMTKDKSITIELLDKAQSQIAMLKALNNLETDRLRDQKMFEKRRAEILKEITKENYRMQVQILQIYNEKPSSIRELDNSQAEKNAVAGIMP